MSRPIIAFSCGSQTFRTASLMVSLSCRSSWIRCTAINPGSIWWNGENMQVPSPTWTWNNIAPSFSRSLSSPRWPRIKTSSSPNWKSIRTLSLRASGTRLDLPILTGNHFGSFILVLLGWVRLALFTFHIIPYLGVFENGRKKVFLFCRLDGEK